MNNLILKERFFGMYYHCKFIDNYGIHKIDRIKFKDKKIAGIGYNEVNISDCKLILRRFGNMNNSEMYNLWNLAEQDVKDKTLNLKFKNIGYNSYTPQQFTYLISIGVNIFEGIVPKEWYIYESEVEK